VKFEPPLLDAEIYERTIAYLAQCAPDAADPESLAELYGRSFRHEYADFLECRRNNDCQLTPACHAIKGKGTVGDAICARQNACGEPCFGAIDDEEIASGIDEWEPLLRPALAAELRRCSREPDCEIAKGCWKALQPAVALASYSP